MKTHQEYLTEFTAFSESSVERYAPSADESLRNGSLARIAAYMESFGDKIIEHLKALTTEGDKILAEVSVNPNIDRAKMKEDLLNIIADHKNKFVSQYKPQKR